MDIVMWSYRRDVNYYETDRMGVIHHSNYLRILEEARMAWMEENLIPYPEIERRGIIVPFTESKATFISFLRFGDTFRVDMALTRFTGLRMHFSYKVYNETTGELCHEAETVHYTTTREDYKPTSVKRSHPDIFEQLKELVSDMD
ncbi:MAG: acyl-CoA thioesterase [Firmicutes bacterium]|nr:acyl-CoA thioesterase [Bacillota bacterium]